MSTILASRADVDLAENEGKQAEISPDHVQAR